MPGLYWHTVDGLLREVLHQIMQQALFDPFRLVGGTALSLQIGHRISVDIDLFTDAAYDSIDFKALDGFLRQQYAYVVTTGGPVGMGTSYFIGNREQEAIKLDLYYTDSFIQPYQYESGIRLATVAEIIAMKVDVVSRGGRKKDFWDLHALLDQYTFADMLQLHKSRYPFAHDEEAIRRNMVDFHLADDDFEPLCLQGKFWELIKYEIHHWIRR